MSRSFAPDPSLARPGGSSAPEPRGVPPFDPLPVRGSGPRLRRALFRRRRAMAAGLAVTAAALAATSAGGAVADGDADARAEAAARAIAGTPPPGHRSAGRAGHRTAREPGKDRPAREPGKPEKRGAWVSAPVRIADAATVRLLRRGDRVDVIATAASPLGPVGSGTGTGSSEGRPEARVVAAGVRVAGIPEPEDSPDGGALVLLSVPRTAAAALAGAGATSLLAVTLC
ncbi:hypothetical protein [Streptomyces sp. NPDC051569]|uniref:hypothetical protein n=1 Tax=Streptomyces sp. NPDC051569 TaxID=3365661 RepID=UPI003787701E